MKSLLIAAIMVTVVLLLQLPGLFFQSKLPVLAPSATPTIIIDPGHGGEDGGAVAVSGEIESHINLAISLKLEQLLLFYGMEPILLRDEDVALHDAGIDTVKGRKTSDLKNRVAMVNEIEQGLLLSIHQNFYTQPQYSGAQVFYTDDSTETQDFAFLLQTLFREQLDPSNERSSKVVDPSIYLFNQIDTPALLIECGFLSNPEEASLLASDDYQQSIACILTVGLLQRNSTLI